MQNINVVAVSGNLTRDPETRDTANSSVTKLRLAVNERTKESGEWADRANYFDVTVWGRQGENINTYLRKGDAVVVSGRLRWREWGEPDEKRQAVEIVASNVQWPPKRDGQTAPRQSDMPADTRDLPEPEPAATQSRDSDPYDDIPF